MNLSKRLTKLESEAAREDDKDDFEMRCPDGQHPPAMFHFYRDYSSHPQHSHRLITKGHCDHCAFDDYFFDVTNTTKEQWHRVNELDHGAERDDYIARLITEGVLDYVDWPPPQPNDVASSFWREADWEYLN